MNQYRHELIEVPASIPFPTLAGILDAKKNEQGADYIGHLTGLRAPRIATGPLGGQPEPVLVLIFRRPVCNVESMHPEPLASVIQ